MEFCNGADELSFFNKDFDIGFIQSVITHSNQSLWIKSAFKTTCLMKEFAKKHNNGNRVSLDQACKRYRIDTSEREVHGAAIDAHLTALLHIEMYCSVSTPLRHTPQKKAELSNERKARPIPRKFYDESTKQYYQLNFCG